MPTPKALHSSKTPRWGTPEHIIELARELMGGIHLDPATSEEFNAYVKALMIYTEKDNGLDPKNEWAGNVFLNPPGGLVNEFWDRLTRDYENGEINKAFWVGFSVEQLCTLGDMKYHPMDFSTVILRKRLNFNLQSTIDIFDEICTSPGEWTKICTGQKEDIKPGNSPSHGNYLTALGCDPVLFDKLFSSYGKIYRGKYALISPLTLV